MPRKRPPIMHHMCLKRKLALAVLSASMIPVTCLFADDWPQWLGPNRDAVWRESGIVEKFPTDGPQILWRVAIGGGYAGPSVGGGRGFVSHRQRHQGVNNPPDPLA